MMSERIYLFEAGYSEQLITGSRMSEKPHPRARTSAPPRIEISNQTLVVWVPGTSITAPGAGVKPCIFRVKKPEWDYLSTTAMLTPTPNESTQAVT